MQPDFYRNRHLCALIEEESGYPASVAICYFDEQAVDQGLEWHCKTSRVCGGLIYKFDSPQIAREFRVPD